MKNKQVIVLSVILVACILVSCSPSNDLLDVTSQACPTAIPVSTQSCPISLFPAPTSIVQQGFTFTGLKPAKPTPNPDIYAPYSIENLIRREYGGGKLQVEQVLEVNSDFTRTLISYPSDGLRIYGYMNTPIGISTLTPVIIAVHGYVDKESYDTLDYSTRYADRLARAGYLVLHPNLRDYPPSDDGDNFFRVGMAVDVLNLAALVREQAGEPGPLKYADPAKIGLWGHSMGGGIVIRAITVSSDFRAALLYASASSDEYQNFKLIYGVSQVNTAKINELSAPEDAFLRISPIYYLDRIQTAVSIHHGELDNDVPPAWSTDLCKLLKDYGKPAECFTYAYQAHLFTGVSDELLIQRTIDFFNRMLR